MAQKRNETSVVNLGEPWSAQEIAIKPCMVPDANNPGHEIDLNATAPSRRSWRVKAHVAPSMAGEGISASQPGEVKTWDDTWGIIDFRPTHAVELPGATPRAFAERVVACVNFCRGVDLATLPHRSLKELLSNGVGYDALVKQAINDYWKAIPTPIDEDENAHASVD